MDIHMHILRQLPNTSTRGVLNTPDDTSTRLAVNLHSEKSKQQQHQSPL